MNITQRQVVLGLFALQLVAALLILVGQIVRRAEWNVTLIVAGSTVVIGALLLAYWRGWDAARYLNVAIITVVIGLGLPEPFVTEYTTPVALIPPALALVLAEPAWIIGAIVVEVAVLTVRGGGHGAYVDDPRTVGALVIIVGAMFLSRVVADTARRAAERSACRAEEALAQSEQQARQIAQSADELVEQNARQRRLIDLVAALETPAVSLADGILLAPLVGRLDRQRAEALTPRLLAAARDQRARLIVLDIAGVPAVDAESAQALSRAARALRLIGCEVTLTGIAPSVAADLTALGGISGISTARSPQDALAHYTGTQKYS